MLTWAIAQGLPQYGALQLGSRVASAAAQLAASKHGVPCVQHLLEMQVGLGVWAKDAGAG